MVCLQRPAFFTPGIEGHTLPRHPPASTPRTRVTFVTCMLIHDALTLPHSISPCTAAGGVPFILPVIQAAAIAKRTHLNTSLRGRCDLARHERPPRTRKSTQANLQSSRKGGEARNPCLVPCPGLFLIFTSCTPARSRGRRGLDLGPRDLERDGNSPGQDGSTRSGPCEPPRPCAPAGD